MRVKRWLGIDRELSKPSILGERQFDITELGYKYHMNNYAAALGIANLRTFQKRLERRRKIADKYSKNLKKITGITLFNYKTDRISSYWLFGFHVEKRIDFIKAMKERGIVTSVVHQRIDRFSIFGGLTKGLVNQKKFDNTQIHIPLHDGLNENDIDYIIESIRKGW